MGHRRVLGEVSALRRGARAPARTARRALRGWGSAAPLRLKIMRPSTLTLLALLACAATCTALQVSDDVRIARRGGQGGLVAKKLIREGSVLMRLDVVELATLDGGLDQLLLNESAAPNKHHVASVLTNVFQDKFEDDFTKYIEGYTRYTTPRRLAQLGEVSELALAWRVAQQRGSWGEYALAFHDPLQAMTAKERQALLPGFADVYNRQHQQVKGWTAAVDALTGAGIRFDTAAPTPEDFMFAANLLRTRAMPSPYGNMVPPFAPYVRPLHGACAGEAVLSAVEDDPDTLVVVAAADVPMHGEICLRYHDAHGTLSDQQLLLRYGVAPFGDTRVGLHYFIFEADMDSTLYLHNCLPGELFLDPHSKQLTEHDFKCLMLHQLPKNVRGDHAVLLGGKQPREEAMAAIGNNIERVLQEVFNVTVPQDPELLAEIAVNKTAGTAEEAKAKQAAADAAAAAAAATALDGKQRRYYKFEVGSGLPRKKEGRQKKLSDEEELASMPDELRELVLKDRERVAQLKAEGKDASGRPLPKDEEEEGTEGTGDVQEQTGPTATIAADSLALEMNAKLSTAIDVLLGYREQLLQKWHESRARATDIVMTEKEREYKRVQTMTQGQLEDLELGRLMREGDDDDDDDGGEEDEYDEFAAGGERPLGMQ